MRDTDAMFDAVHLQATALDVNLACRRLRLNLGALRDRDRVAFTDAAGFVDRARRSQRMRVSRRLSATPSSDLLALRYTQEAKRKVAAGNVDLEQTLNALSSALGRLSSDGTVPVGNPWGLDQIDRFFTEIFWLATGIAAQPTDLTRSGMRRPAVLEKRPSL